MSIESKIEWTQATWNPVTGCTKISAGCEHCYAATLAKRLKAMGNVRYKNGFQVTVHKDLLERPLYWKEPKMIFVNSMSDIFHDDIPDDVILKIFNTMNLAYWHTFQILTKRPERMLKIAKKVKWTENIWMGVTVENRSVLNRVKLLKKCGAKVKFISAEPLLESIKNIDLDGIDWIIVGGESGKGYRPIDKEWVMELKEKAKGTGTAFFFKQWGGYPKNKKGSLLNGRYYKAYPKRYKSDR